MARKERMQNAKKDQEQHKGEIGNVCSGLNVAVREDNSVQREIKKLKVMMMRSTKNTTDSKEEKKNESGKESRRDKTFVQSNEEHEESDEAQYTGVDCKIKTTEILGNYTWEKLIQELAAWHCSSCNGAVVQEIPTELKKKLLQFRNGKGSTLKTTNKQDEQETEGSSNSEISAQLDLLRAFSPEEILHIYDISESTQESDYEYQYESDHKEEIRPRSLTEGKQTGIQTEKKDVCYKDSYKRPRIETEEKDIPQGRWKSPERDIPWDSYLRNRSQSLHTPTIGLDYGADEVEEDIEHNLSEESTDYVYDEYGNNNDPNSGSDQLSYEDDYDNNIEDESQCNSDGSINIMKQTQVLKLTPTLKISIAKEEVIHMLKKVLLDSGASMSACPPIIIRLYNLQPRRWLNPKKIEFGNGTVTYSKLYVDLGPFIGIAAIVPAITVVIASITRANIKGYYVKAASDMQCCILSTAKEIVATGQFCLTDQLYYAKLEELMEIVENPLDIRLQTKWTKVMIKSQQDNVVLDMGASMSACPASIAHKLNLQQKRWRRPKRIEFGNGTVAIASHYVDLGPFIGQASIIKSIKSVVASITRANKRGYIVCMRPEMQCHILTKGEEKVAIGQVCSEDLLYYADLNDIMRIPNSRNKPRAIQTEQEVEKTNGKRKSGRKRGGALDEIGKKIANTESNGISITTNGSISGYSEFECLKYLAPNISVEETDTGEILIRRQNYGMIISQTELRNYINEKLHTNEGNEVLLPFRALYRYTDEEFSATAGLGLCSMLAIVGILCPTLNSTKSMESIEGRNCIATSLEQIVIPALEMYIQDPNYTDNPNAHKHSLYKDVTVQHLTTFIELLRNTSDIYVASDKWMETSDVGIIIQSLPHSAVLWQEIGDNNWVALDLWSNVATRSTIQNIQVLKEVLVESTGHIIFGCSHFFNIDALLPIRYSNLMIEIDYAIDIIKSQIDKQKDNQDENNLSNIGAEYLDRGTVTLQKKDAEWFISISKDKLAKLSKLNSEQIRDKVCNGRGNIFTVHKKIHSVNWSLIRGDGTCGYQSLHAVALHAANKSMDEISRSTKTSDKPILLIKFLQDMVPKLQSQLLANSRSRVLKVIDSLQKNKKIDISQWCPTEIMEEILPTLHPNSRCWHHTMPPVRSSEWISTYYSTSWLSEEQGLDIVFNGIDHFTIQPNTEIERSELLEGIHNMIEVIKKTYNIKGEWTVKHGMKNSAQRTSPDISIDEYSELEEGFTKVSRGKKTKGHGTVKSNNQDQIQVSVQTVAPPVTPKIMKVLYSNREVNARMKAPICYAPKYHPLDDPLPIEEIKDIPFPKKSRDDKTAWKYLLEAPSRLGKGQGVYTITKIPADTIIMEYLDEDAEKNIEDRLHRNSTGTAYVYVNELTSTRIDATNNKDSYCGLVNEAFEEKNFNTIICERKVDGKTKVFFKTTREINAKEEIGTRYTNDGSYWRKSQHSEETMSRVDRCYNIVTPIKEKNEVLGNTDSEGKTTSPRIQLFRVQEMEVEINRLHDGFKQGTQEIDMDISDELWADLSDEQVSKEGSEDDEVYGSDEGRYSTTIYHNTTIIETKEDGTINFFSYDKNIEETPDNNKQVQDTKLEEQRELYEDIRMNQVSSESNESNESIGETINHSSSSIEYTGDETKQELDRIDNEKIGAVRAKRKRVSNQPNQKDSTKQHKRGQNRSKKQSKGKSSPEQEELSVRIERERLQRLTKDEIIDEYLMDQRCRHKKMLIEKIKLEKQGEDSKSGTHKTKVCKVAKLLLIEHNKLMVPATFEVTCQITKVHGLRKRKAVDYAKQLDTGSKMGRPSNKICNEPLKPRYTLDDPTVMSKGMFMIAQSGLKHKQHGVFSREAIPLKRNRILFEYRSEHNHGTRDHSEINKYISGQPDNKFMVQIGDIIVDATNNTSSYCNYVQELLNDKHIFNCKYAKTGDTISIVQIAPIGKYEELNIQYSKDGEYWRNRTTGYPEVILKRARKYYQIEEPVVRKREKDVEEIPDYVSRPKITDKDDFNLMDFENLFKWNNTDVESNIRIGTLNMNGALYESKNGEPYFAYQLMTQCGLNILGLTDTRTPSDKEEQITASIRYVQPKGTAIISFPTQRLNKESNRLTTLGGQMIIVDRQWEPHISNKKSDASGLSLITSISITYSKQTLVIIQVMVPPASTGEYSMWERTKEYLKEVGIRQNPRDYVLETASKWHINEKSKGHMVIIMGDFNRTNIQMHNWELQNILIRAHQKMDIAQVHPDRKLYTFLRNAKIHTHIDHIYYTGMATAIVTEVGATDHPHIHEKTDHFPIWIGLKLKCKMEENKEKMASTSIRNKPDLDIENKEENELFGLEMDEYVQSLGKIKKGILPEEAGRIQAAIFAKSAEIAADHAKQSPFQASRPQGRMHRYKDCFSPDFRILQESLHTYINLGRILDRLRKNKSTSIIRIRELNRLYPKWRRLYNRYYSKTHPDDHADTMLFPSDLIGINIQQSKQIDIAGKIARLKARMHGRRRMALRAKLSERCRIMQTHMDINKLKKVIQMVIPTARSALDYAALTTENGDYLKDDMVDREANKVMKSWMSVPGDIHPIAREFEVNPEKWKQLLHRTYTPPESNIPSELLQQVMSACAKKVLNPGVALELHDAMTQSFSFEEFNNARCRLTKDKSPGPSGVTNNQMKRWKETTTRTVFDLSNIMWKHHSVPQFWQDRLMTLLPKISGVNDLSKIRPISLFENIRKLWAGMVSRRVQGIWHKHNVLHPNQHGFRWQRGTHTAVLHLLNQLELADNTEPTYLTMWDIRRAFDSVPKWLQRLAWARLGMAEEDLEWFLKLDETGNIYIRTPEFELNKQMTNVNEHLKRQLPMLHSPTANQFHPERGIGQGDTPSTLIFIAVFDILLTLLGNSGTGIPHAYADDLAHAAKTQEQQQQQADLVSVFCVVTSLEITTPKVEAIALNHSRFFTTTLVLRDWQWIPHLIVQSDKDFWTRYLGIYLDSEHCDRHFDMAIKQYRAACHALLFRIAPSSAKRMVHMMCLRPKIRYIASLAPWSLQQHQQIDKVPYQLLCQIYGLRRGFPLALIYAPINVGGCGEIKFSDEVNSMKWKILHSNMHLGGISADVSNTLIQRALERKRNKLQPRGYVDSLLQWGCEMGLQLMQHKQMPMPYCIVRLRQMLVNQDPTKALRVYSSGSIGLDASTTTIQRLVTPIARQRMDYGTGQTGIYIEGMLTNGKVSRFAIQIAPKGQSAKLSTTFLHELLGIIVGMQATKNVGEVRVYSDCKSVVTRVQEAQREGSKSLLHLPYGPILRAIMQASEHKCRIQYIPPKKGKKKDFTWERHRDGMQMAKSIAAKPMDAIRSKLMVATTLQGNIGETIDALIPEGTWIWRNTAGALYLESLRVNALRHSHIRYLNRRDTLRNKMDLLQPSRWSRYNMQFATVLTETREKCSARIRGHNCKQMYDWTTHAVNLAKGINNEAERVAASKCILCKLDKPESQIHTSTTCQHVDLVYIRRLYKKDIDKILEAFNHVRMPKKEDWLRKAIIYIRNNMWGDTQIAADIWNGRWSQIMWQEALIDTAEQFNNNDISLGKQWMQKVTSKLFEAQSAMSRQRFKLVKRLSNPLFERPGGIPSIIKKRLFQEHEHMECNKTVKRRKRVHRSKGVKGPKAEELPQSHTKKRKGIETKGEKRQRTSTGTYISEPVESETIEVAASGDDKIQIHCKRKSRESLLIRPHKKKATSRSIIMQDIIATTIGKKKWESHKKLCLTNIKQATQNIGTNKLTVTKKTPYKKLNLHMKSRHYQEDKKGGMYTDCVDEVDYETDIQITLQSLNTAKKEWIDWDEDTRVREKQEVEEDTSTYIENELRFINTFQFSVKVDQDAEGRLIFRGGEYGLLITKEEASECFNMVMQNKPIEEIIKTIEIQALYNSSTDEFGGTEGNGLCGILAIAGTIHPQLNSSRVIGSREGRDNIAELMENTILPSIRKYTKLDDLEGMVYSEQTIEYLEQITTLLRGTMDTEVDRDRWMRASSVATVVQTSPIETAYWKGIGIQRWIALDSWSWSAAKKTKQTILVLETVLRPSTRHIVFLNSHFFNTEEIGYNTFKNLFTEMVNAMVEIKNQGKNSGIPMTTQMPANRTKRKDALSQTSDTKDMMAPPARVTKKKERKMQRRRSQIHMKDTQEENDTR